MRIGSSHFPSPPCSALKWHDWHSAIVRLKLLETRIRSDWHIGAVMAQKMCAKVFYVYLPTSSVCPKNFHGHPTHHEFKICMTSVSDELRRSDVFHPFFLPHGHAQRLRWHANIDPSGAIPLAGEYERRELAISVKLASHVAKPSGQSNWLGEGRPYFFDVRLVTSTDPYNSDAIVRMQRRFDTSAPVFGQRSPSILFRLQNSETMSRLAKQTEPRPHSEAYQMSIASRFWGRFANFCRSSRRPNHQREDADLLRRSLTQSCTKRVAKVYNLVMSKMSVSKARERLSEVVEMSQSEPVVLELYGRRAAVIVSPDHYDEMLDAFEESQDVLAFDAALAEDGDNIPWEQVKIDLGWS